MKASYIDYSETNSFSPAIIRYLENDPNLDQFRAFAPTIDGFSKLIAAKKDVCNRQVLVDVLKSQYQRVNGLVSDAVNQNINLLSNKNTFTVTTGHQLNLFTGPLYFIFKIVNAINLAKELKSQFPQHEFVPVYWMATEDHDFAEINHTYIAGKKVSWDTEASGATGRMTITAFEKTIRDYTGTLGISDEAKALATLITNAYQQGSTLADATRSFVNSLFSNYGLVIIDADDAQLKREFSPIITDDIINQHSYKNISETSKKLHDLGIESQVNPREINFFYLQDGLRERIVFENDVYEVLNTEIRFSADELKNEIESHPERFSPNVVMRPLYQEVILPNIAYIGGGAEIVYWLQLKQNFDHYNIDFPVLLLRNSAMITSKNLVSKLSRLDLGFPDIFKDTESLRKEWVFDHTAHKLDLDDEWKDISAVFDRIKTRTSKIDPTLSPSSEAVKARLHKAFNNLETKLIKAEKRNFADALSQIESIKTKLFPKGGLQERTENFGLFYVRYGEDFISMLVEYLKPLDQKFTILED